MTAEQIIGLILALLVMGVAGAILPGLPSTPLVLLAAIGHKIYFGANGVGRLVMTLLVGFTLLSLVMDYIATFCGAKKLGATWRGAAGAIVGGLIGMFFNLPGILLGPFIGALTFELLGGRKLKDATKAGAGATIGLFAGVVGKLACCGVMIVAFIVNVIYRSPNQ